LRRATEKEGKNIIYILNFSEIEEKRKGEVGQEGKEGPYNLLSRGRGEGGALKLNLLAREENKE